MFAKCSDGGALRRYQYRVIVKKVKARLNSFSLNTSSWTGSARLRRGFCLVEKLTVMAIMSIVAVLSMSSFSLLCSASLASSDNQMVDVQPASPARMALRLIEGSVDPGAGAFTYRGTKVSRAEVGYYDLVSGGNTGMIKIGRS